MLELYHEEVVAAVQWVQDAMSALPNDDVRVAWMRQYKPHWIENGGKYWMHMIALANGVA